MVCRSDARAPKAQPMDQPRSRHETIHVFKCADVVSPALRATYPAHVGSHFCQARSRVDGWRSKLKLEVAVGRGHERWIPHDRTARTRCAAQIVGKDGARTDH